MAEPSKRTLGRQISILSHLLSYRNQITPDIADLWPEACLRLELAYDRNGTARPTTHTLDAILSAREERKTT